MNLLNNTDEASQDYLIHLYYHDKPINITISDLYIKDNSGFIKEYCVDKNLSKYLHFINCYTDFVHETYTDFMKLTDDIQIPLINDFTTYMYPLPDNNNNKKKSISWTIPVIVIVSLLGVTLILVSIYLFHTKRKYRKIESSLELNRAIINDFG